MKDFPNTDFLIKNKISPIWLRWLNDLKNAVDQIHKSDFVLHSSGTINLTQFHLGKTNIFSIDSTDTDVNLPSVDSTDLYKWIKIIRYGTGQLRINSVDNDYIEFSTGPGSIWCNEPRRRAANLTLQLIEEDVWAIISGTGIWKTV